MSRLNRRSRMSRFMKVCAAALVVVGSGSTIARAADSTGALDESYGGAGNNGIFFGTAPSGVQASSTEHIIAGPNNSTYHLIQHITSGVMSGYSIAHVKSDGTLDTTFDSDGMVTVEKKAGDDNFTVNKLLLVTVGSDSKLLVLGTYKSGGTYLARFNASGSSIGALDTTFGTAGEVRQLTNVFPTDQYDFAVGTSGKIYVWGQWDTTPGTATSTAMIRFSDAGTLDTGWGSGSAKMSAPASPIQRIVGIDVNDSASPVLVTVWGSDASSATTNNVMIGRWKMTAGQANAVWDTSYVTNGYKLLDVQSSVSGIVVKSSSVSPNGNVYMLVAPPMGSSGNTRIAAFKKSDGTVISTFKSPAASAGLVDLSDFTDVYEVVATKDASNADRVYVLGTKTVAGGLGSPGFVLAYGADGQLIANFGANGRMSMGACPRGLNVQTIGVASDSAVIVGGSETTRYFAIRLSDGTFKPFPTCGAANSPNGGSGGGGGGGGSTLPTLTATITEVEGPAIKVTVPALAAGAQLYAMVTPSTYTPAPPEAPIMNVGKTGETSLTLTLLRWVNTQTNSVRTEAFQIGTKYTVEYWQQISSPRGNSMLARGSITLTGTVTTPSSGSATAGSTTAGTTTTGTATTAAVPGVTVTDAKVYTKAPTKVASGSAITVLTPTQVKTQTIRTSTPAVCLPTTDDIVFIDEGRCSATVLNKKTGEVLRRLRTTVVDTEVTEIGIGNEIVTLAPIYFDAGSADLNTKAIKRLRALKSRISAAGTVMVVGHSGTLMGNTPENIAMSRDRAVNTVRAMKRIGAKGPFFSTGAGALDPVTTSSDRTEQNKNRRVVVVLVP